MHEQVVHRFDVSGEQSHRMLLFVGNGTQNGNSEHNRTARTLLLRPRRFMFRELIAELTKRPPARSCIDIKPSRWNSGTSPRAKQLVGGHSNFARQEIYAARLSRRSKIAERVVKDCTGKAFCRMELFRVDRLTVILAC
jgi:hypothetical protein